MSIVTESVYEMEKKKMKIWKKVLLQLAVLVVILAAALLGINQYVVSSAQGDVLCTVSDKANTISKRS